ncbi:MAG: ABC transporter permease [Chitinophagales bacterium]|nr:ABC transporter permease [Chitinophagales bacterium]
MFVKKEIAVQYKQTVLGPLWYFIQPIFTTIIFVFVFGNIAKISTDGLPQPLFYMCGIVIWNFFADCFIKTSDTFTQNSNLFGKVYFPRLISPLSVVISNLIKFFIQFGLFIIILIYYSTQLNFTIKITYSILFVPFLILIMGILGLGFGLIFSSLTTKYKDLKFLLQFGIQLLMYATPIIYPLKSVSKKMQEILLYNPITSVIEAFKYIFLGEGYFSVPWVLYSFFIALLILMFGVLIFNKTEQTFMDII